LLLETLFTYYRAFAIIYGLGQPNAPPFFMIFIRLLPAIFFISANLLFVQAFDFLSVNPSIKLLP
jgi:hypothetical protein